MMYNSLQSLLDLTVTIKPFIKRTGAGTKQFGEGIDVRCYAEGKVINITDEQGIEVVSMTQIYLDGNTAIKSTDCVIFETKESSIKSIRTYYRKGKADLKVVYL